MKIKSRKTLKVLEPKVPEGTYVKLPELPEQMTIGHLEDAVRIIVEYLKSREN